jgi:pyrroloquinoline quinone biosynthesis protein E
VTKSHEHKLREVCLEVNDICLMRCLHCSGECGVNSQRSLGVRQIKEVIDDFHAMGGRVLEISGGEPLICRHIPQIARYATQRDLETILYTSGAMLNETVLGELFRSRLGKIIFNLQGSNPRTHETITQVEGSFNKVLTAIKETKRLGFWVGVHFVPMKPNYREFRMLLSLCNNLEVDEVGVLRLVPQGRALLNRRMLELSKEELMEFTLDLTEQTSADSRVRVGCPIDFRHFFNSSIVESTCNAGISRCLINPDGGVVPCPAFKQSKQHLAGNIKYSSLINIWDRSPVWQSFRDFDYRQLDEPCQTCIHLQTCRGKCIAQRMMKYGDICSAPDPQCFASCLKAESTVLLA